MGHILSLVEVKECKDVSPDKKEEGSNLLWEK